MKLSLQRAKEIKMVFLDEIERTRTIPGHLVQPFWEFYSKEFNPGEYSAMPCTCSPKLWAQMMINVTNAVNEAFAEDATLVLVEVPQEVVEEPKKKTVKSKKSTTADAVEEDTKTNTDEESI
jgi:hypothetical protein